MCKIKINKYLHNLVVNVQSIFRGNDERVAGLPHVRERQNQNVRRVTQMNLLSKKRTSSSVSENEHFNKI